jgi:quinol monooxygenase YgiN
MSISIVVEIKSKNDDSINTVRTICNELVSKSSIEKGCSYYQLLNKFEEEGTLLLVEKWQDNDSLNAHNESDHFKTLVPQLVENAEIGYLKKFNVYNEFTKRPSNDDLYINEKVIRLVVFVEVLNEDEFIKLASELANISNTEEGCLEYTFAKSIENSNEWVFVELWSNEQSLSEHSASEHCKRLIPLLDKVSTVKSVAKGIKKIYKNL